jgi:hypothetical protein
MVEGMALALAPNGSSGVCVRSVDRGRLTLPTPATTGQRLWLTALGQGWLEMTTEADAPNLMVCVTLGHKNRFVLPRGYVRYRFGVERDPLVSVVTDHGALMSALVFSLQHLPRRDHAGIADLVVADTLHHLASSASTHPGRFGRQDHGQYRS